MPLCRFPNGPLPKQKSTHLDAALGANGTPAQFTAVPPGAKHGEARLPANEAHLIQKHR